MEITKGQAYPRGFASLDLPDDDTITPPDERHRC